MCPRDKHEKDAVCCPQGNCSLGRRGKKEHTPKHAVTIKPR